MKIITTADSGASVPWTDHFTGTAWMDLILQERLGEVDGAVAVTTVTFTPGVRTHWHRHQGGQMLLVVAGQGWVGARNAGPQVVGAGDVVWASPTEDHWHGATATTTMTHLAVTLGATVWFDEVLDLLPT